MTTTTERRVTKSPSQMWCFRLTKRDRELLYMAAAREDVSQSDFVRKAVRERAARVLASPEPA
jgi:uncharacterized protein (DUF1778 family)